MPLVFRLLRANNSAFLVHTLFSLYFSENKNLVIYFQTSFWMLNLITSCFWVDDLWYSHRTNSAATWFHVFVPYFAQLLLYCKHFFWIFFYESLSTLPTLQFDILITTVHQAGFHLERAALFQAYHLIHQQPVHQLSMPHSQSLGHHVPLHSVIFLCYDVETSNVG